MTATYLTTYIMEPAIENPAPDLHLHQSVQRILKGCSHPPSLTHGQQLSLTQAGDPLNAATYSHFITVNRPIYASSLTTFSLPDAFQPSQSKMFLFEM